MSVKSMKCYRKSNQKPKTGKPKKLRNVQDQSRRSYIHLRRIPEGENKGNGDKEIIK